MGVEVGRSRWTQNSWDLIKFVVSMAENHTNLLSYSLEGGVQNEFYCTKISVLTGPSTGALEENVTLALLASGGCRLSLACGHIAAVSASVVTLPPPLL